MRVADQVLVESHNLVISEGVSEDEEEETTARPLTALLASLMPSLANAPPYAIMTNETIANAANTAISIGLQGISDRTTKDSKQHSQDADEDVDQDTDQDTDEHAAAEAANTTDSLQPKNNPKRKNSPRV